MPRKPADNGDSMDSPLKNIRRDFVKGVLLENELPESPHELFSKWLKDAGTQAIPDHNAMSLSTIDGEGFPVSRIVLLREVTSDGFCFYTKELRTNPKAAIQFFWPAMERQIRIRGVVEALTALESDAYFASRPRDSQLGAWASPQSEIVGSRAFLDENFARYQEKFKDVEKIPRPPHWGGFRLRPNQFEFWQGRPSRMHDRFRVSLDGLSWRWQRLAP
jgi:pyridoxamine 5'-phosphate oxidase